MPGGQGAEEERQLGSGCAGLRVAATPRACPCRSEDPENTFTRRPQKSRGHWRQRARDARGQVPLLRQSVVSSKAHSPSAGTRARAATASPTSGRRSIRDRPQDYVTAVRRPMRAYRSAARLRTRTAQNRQCGCPPSTARRHYVTPSGPAHSESPGLVTAAGLRHSSASVCEGQRRPAGGGAPHCCAGVLRGTPRRPRPFYP